MITLTSETLDELVNAGEAHDAETVMATLGCDRATIFEMLIAGRLDGIVLGGRAVVSARSANAFAWSRLELIQEEEAVKLARLSGLLTSYIETHPLTGDLEQHLNHGRPLVTSRKGDASVHKKFGPEFHAVVLNCYNLHEFALTQSEATQDVVPSLGQFFDDMTHVRGVTATTWATPLFGESKPIRVRRGLRINLSQRSVELPPDLLAYVSTPPGERYALDRDDEEVIDPHEAERGMYGDAWVDAKIASGEWTP